MGGGSPSPRPSHSSAPCTVKPKLTQAAPTSGAWPQGSPRGVVSSSPGQMVLRAVRTVPIISPGPLSTQIIPSPIKQKRNSEAPTSERRDGSQRWAAHSAPSCSSRPRLADGSSLGGDDGGSGGDRGSRVRSLPRTQHLERRTAPRLIPLTPPPLRCRVQWRPGARPGGRPLGGAFPSSFEPRPQVPGSLCQDHIPQRPSALTHSLLELVVP